MLNICDELADNNSTRDSIAAAGAQAALLTM